jgi:hypothetical protein
VQVLVDALYLDIWMDRGLAKSLEPTHGIGNCAHCAQTVARLMARFKSAAWCLHYHTLPNLPCDFHLEAPAASLVALPSTPSPLLGSLAHCRSLLPSTCLSHCTVFSNTRQYCGSKPANYFTPKNGTRSKPHPAHTLFLNQKQAFVHSSCSGRRSFRALRRISGPTAQPTLFTTPTTTASPATAEKAKQQWTQWHKKRHP